MDPAFQAGVRRTNSTRFGLADARRQGSGLALFATDLGAAAFGRGQAA